MPPMRLEDLAPDLACPRCGERLSAGPNNYRCTGPGCGQDYQVIGGQPILVDFEQSILVEDEVKAGETRSVIERGKHGLKRKITSRLLPTNQAAAANATRFIELARALTDRPKVLVIGGGSQGEGTDALYSNSALQLISFDIYGSSLTQFVADAHHTPLASSSVDAVWVQAVLEHVLDPWQVARDIHRV